MAKTEFRIGGKPVKPDPAPTPDPAPKPEASNDTGDAPLSVRDKAINALREVYDPEIPLNIYDLGLIYAVDVDETNHVKLTMTLTSPACPVAQDLPLEARQAVERVPEVNGCEVDLTFDPPWTMENLSDEAKLQLGFL